MIRYGKLSDAQILKKVTDICKIENVSHTDDGLEAIIFTAQGDLRQVKNSRNLFLFTLLHILT